MILDQFEPIPEWMFEDTIEAKNALQHCGRVHPYTCDNPDCRTTLRATADGWVCDLCNAEQPNNT